MKFLAAKHVRDIWYVLYSHKFLKMARIIKEKKLFSISYNLHYK